MGRSAGNRVTKATDPGGRAVRFIENLTLTGDYSGQPMRLRPWQSEPIRKVFGTLRPDGTRQYRTVFEALPRKQAKTEKLASTALYLLLGQGRGSQRIYTAAGDTEQASLIFNAAKEKVEADPTLSKICRIYFGNEKKIEYPAGNSFLKVLSSVPGSKHGLGPTAVLIDELHVVDEELVNVLTTGFGARRDPLTWFITTAGWDRSSYCWDEWQYALRVLRGEVDDPTYLPIIHAAEPGDDWTSEDTWHKAMPALGDFCSLDFIRQEFRKAQERPRFENTFKQLYLNLWTEQAERWLPVDRWAECAGDVELDDLAGLPCFVGFDLAQTRDLTAFALLWADGDRWILKLRFWAPEFGSWREEASARKSYLHWADRGALTLTDGEVTDYNQVESEVVALLHGQDVRAMWGDKMGALNLALRLQDEHGYPVKFIPQTAVWLNDACRELERRILARTIVHENCPVMNACVANAVIRENTTGLIQPDKRRATGRIDGVAAAINAIAAARNTLTDVGDFVYEGLEVL